MKQEDFDYNEQQLEDWGATDLASAETWGKTKNPYKQTATAFSAEARYDQLLVALPTLPAFVDGACLRLRSTALLLVTPVDSLALRIENGLFSIAGSQLKASGFSMPWPTQENSYPTTGLRVEAKELNINMASGRMLGEASLQADALLNEAAEGIFEARLHVRKGIQPHFLSQRNDHKLKLPYDAVTYTGGINLRLNTLYGAAAGGKPGHLRIGDETGIHLKATARRFRFDSADIVSPRTAVSIYDDSDSLQHPGMELKYKTAEKKLLLIRKKPFGRAPMV